MANAKKGYDVAKKGGFGAIPGVVSAATYGAYKDAKKQYGYEVDKEREKRIDELEGRVPSIDKAKSAAVEDLMANEIEKLILPDSLEVIDGSSFINNKISDLLIPSSVVSIKSTAFSNNPFKSITLENTDAILENCAFGNISELETHNIPSTYVCNN